MGLFGIVIFFVKTIDVVNIYLMQFMNCIHFSRIPSSETFKVPTIANIPKKSIVKSSTVNQLQNNMKAASLNDKVETNKENDKNMGLSSKKEE